MRTSDFCFFFNSMTHRVLHQRAGYNVYWKKLETDLHGGLPQHRTRVYIVGLRADCHAKEFVWPTEISNPLTLEQVLGPGTCSQQEQLAALARHVTEKNFSKTILNNFKVFAEVLQKAPGDYILDVGGSKPNYMLNRSPCLTLSRCRAPKAYWSNARNRWLGVEDFLKLHGVPPSSYAGWADMVSPQTMREMCGNAMSLSVVRRLVRAVLVARGWLS